MGIEYITTRELENSSGEIKGKVRILKLAEGAEAAVEYICPECGFAEKRKESWREPFLDGIGTNQKFIFNCKKCGYKIKLMKLKKEVKKKK